MKKALFSIFASLATATSLTAAPQAIVFDWGNVIGFNDRSVIVNFICESFQFSDSEFEAASLEKRKAVEAGKTDVDFWIGLANTKEINLPHDWAKRYTLTLKESVGADPNMYVLIEELKSKGMRIAMLSNISDHYKKMLHDFGFYDPFDPCLLSCEIGLDKPDPMIYELLIKTIELNPQDIVFIDDKLENTEAAKEMGIDAILFESLPQLKAELLKRGALK